jgi:hypothetical protein
MKQICLDTTGFEPKTKRTRKREFLDEMNLQACRIYANDCWIWSRGDECVQKRLEGRKWVSNRHKIASHEPNNVVI